MEEDKSDISSVQFTGVLEIDINSTDKFFIYGMDHHRCLGSKLFGSYLLILSETTH